MSGLALPDHLSTKSDGSPYRGPGERFVCTSLQCLQTRPRDGSESGQECRTSLLAVVVPPKVARSVTDLQL